ncbi:uncharacterized protein DAT39_000889, partial [Clarias magur]
KLFTCTLSQIYQKQNTLGGGLQQRVTPWQTLMSDVWLVVVLAALVPYTVYYMLTALKTPPQHPLFNIAAISFGILSEILLF